MFTYRCRVYGDSRVRRMNEPWILCINQPRTMCHTHEWMLTRGCCLAARCCWIHESRTVESVTHYMIQPRTVRVTLESCHTRGYWQCELWNKKYCLRFREARDAVCNTHNSSRVETVVLVVVLEGILSAADTWNEKYCLQCREARDAVSHRDGTFLLETVSLSVVLEGILSMWVVKRGICLEFYEARETVSSRDGTARSRRDETRNGRRNRNRNPW